MHEGEILTLVRVIGAAALLATLAACGNGTVASTAVPVDRGPVASLPERETALPGSVDCEYESSGKPASKDVRKPGSSASATGLVEVGFEFAGGSVTLELDRALAPCTVNSFVSLAEQGYFDDTECHRLTTYPALAVLQCGDPSATGSGGPGYQFADEFPADESTAETFPYSRGFVAMANAGAGTNGSQFFIVFGESELPPAYTIFGRVAAGIDVIDGIADAGVQGGSQDGPPASAVEIVTASVK